MKISRLSIQYYFLVFVVVSMLLVVGCGNEEKNNFLPPTHTNTLEETATNPADSVPTEIPSDNDQFQELVGEDVILNESLIVSSHEEVITLSNSNQIGEYIVIDLFSHSDENILFTNMDFNLRAYKKVDQGDNSIAWKEVILTIVTPEMEVILYPDSTTNIGNSMVPIIVQMIQDLDFDDHVRFYFAGIGEISGNEYGAFFDVQIVGNE